MRLRLASHLNHGHARVDLGSLLEGLKLAIAVEHFRHLDALTQVEIVDELVRWEAFLHVPRLQPVLAASFQGYVVHFLISVNVVILAHLSDAVGVGLLLETNLAVMVQRKLHA